MRHGATLLAGLITTALTVSADPPVGHIFSDDFESGGTCHWSAAQPACGFCPDGHTLALWHFEEGSGQTVVDASSWGHDLHLGSSTAPGTDDPAWASGRFGSGLFFTSSSGTYASQYTPIAFSINQLTVELWIRPIGGSGSFEESTPFSAVNGVTCYFVLSTLDNTVGVGVGDGNDWALDLYFDADPVDLDDGAWHYLALTYDGATLAAYLDGVLADSGPVSVILSSANDWSVGGRGAYLDGWMDEVRVSNVARSSAEIAAAWNGALSCPPGRAE